MYVCMCAFALLFTLLYITTYNHFRHLSGDEISHLKILCQGAENIQ